MTISLNYLSGMLIILISFSSFTVIFSFPLIQYIVLCLFVLSNCVCFYVLGRLAMSPFLESSGLMQERSCALQCNPGRQIVLGGSSGKFRGRACITSKVDGGSWNWLLQASMLGECKKNGTQQYLYSQKNFLKFLAPPSYVLRLVNKSSYILQVILKLVLLCCVLGSSYILCWLLKGGDSIFFFFKPLNFLPCSGFPRVKPDDF